MKTIASQHIACGLPAGAAGRGRVRTGLGTVASAGRGAGMRASWLAVAAALAGVLPCGAASAQEGGQVCRSFCEAQAAQCRKEAREKSSWDATPLPTWTTQLKPPPQGFSDDPAKTYSHAVDADLAKRNQDCGEARHACMQRCAPDVATPGAATPASSASSAVPSVAASRPWAGPTPGVVPAEEKKTPRP